MRYEAMRQAFSARPFHPLLVRMVSGFEYRVTTRESIVSPRFATFLLEDGVHATVALEFVEEIRPLPKRRSPRSHKPHPRR